MYRNHSGAMKHDAKRGKSKSRTDCVRKETKSCESRKAGENKSKNNYNFLKDLIIL